MTGAYTLRSNPSTRRPKRPDGGMHCFLEQSEAALQGSLGIERGRRNAISRSRHSGLPGILGDSRYRVLSHLLRLFSFRVTERVHFNLSRSRKRVPTT